MARIGQLMIQGGRCEGRQLVPEAWLAESTTVHVNGDFGYYWWVELDGVVYNASGDGEQKIWVDERNELVVVLVGDPGAKSWVLSRRVAGLFDEIYRAIQNP